jgi:hypothetical protein
VPAGGLAWPEESSPQQASVSSVFTPQLWEPPAETESKVPAGGVAWPNELRARANLPLEPRAVNSDAESRYDALESSLALISSRS